MVTKTKGTRGGVCSLEGNRGTVSGVKGAWFKTWQPGSAPKFRQRPQLLQRAAFFIWVTEIKIFLVPPVLNTGRGWDRYFIACQSHPLPLVRGVKNPRTEEQCLPPPGSFSNNVSRGELGGVHQESQYWGKAEAGGLKVGAQSGQTNEILSPNKQASNQAKGWRCSSMPRPWVHPQHSK